MKIHKAILSGLLLAALLSCSNSGGTAAADKGNAAGNPQEAPVYLTQEEFATKVFDYQKSKEWSYAGDIPCIIDFYADWCRPCKMVAPIMEELAKTYAGKVRFYKVNTDKEKDLAQAFNIQSIPAILFVPAKGQPQMSVGAMAKEEYIKTIDSFLLPVQAPAKQ